MLSSGFADIVWVMQHFLLKKVALFRFMISALRVRKYLHLPFFLVHALRVRNGIYCPHGIAFIVENACRAEFYRDCSIVAAITSIVNVSDRKTASGDVTSCFPGALGPSKTAKHFKIKGYC